MSLNNGFIDIDEVRKWLAPDFLATFTALLATLEIQETKERAKLAKQESKAISSGTTITNLKRSADPQDGSYSSVPMRKFAVMSLDITYSNQMISLMIIS